MVTADGAFRGSKMIALKEIVDEGLQHCSTVDKVIVLERTKQSVSMQVGRDVWWHEQMLTASRIRPAEVMDSEDSLFILYTSGSTGKPRGSCTQLEGTWFMLSILSVMFFQYEEGDVYWCTADIGWITGHSYIIYGPLLAGANTLMFEGIPTYPDAGRFWNIVDKYSVNIFYTAPTAIRALQAKGLDFVKPYKLNSLKVLGTVGEPINEEAWQWYKKYWQRKMSYC